ncbi:MAG: hypothetical protein NT086_15865 [Proteobacteria bacterium]|nr:hypothetical protein [Pseudomonadota bacterium]
MTKADFNAPYRLLKGDKLPGELHPSCIGVATYLTKETTKRYKGSSLNEVKTIYPSAIELSDIHQCERGMPSMFALFVFSMCFPFSLFTFYFGFIQIQAVDFLSILFNIILIPFFFAFFFVTSLLEILMFRFDLFPLKGGSLILDRKNKKVYRAVRDYPEMLDYFKNSFKKCNPFYAWPTLVIEYNWDALVFVFASKTVVYRGGPLTTNTLAIGVEDPDFAQKQAAKSDHDKAWDLILKHEDKPDFVDFFVIGNPLEMDEYSAHAFWTYLRAYMEENGPALPAGESLAEAAPTTWWQSMGVASPFGARANEWARDRPILFILFLLTFPVSVPLSILWGTFNWLSHKTAFEAPFPPEIRAGWGKALSPQKKTWRPYRQR